MPSDKHSTSEQPLDRLLARVSRFCWARAWLVVAMWALLAGAAMLANRGMADRLVSGSGVIAGSMSDRVDQMLSTDFDARDGQALVLVMSGGDADRWEVLDAALRDRLTRLAEVKSIIAAEELVAPREGAQGHALLVSLDIGGASEAERMVPIIRDAVARVFATNRPDVEWAVTGRAALTHDIATFSAQDSARAELRALPLAFIVLVIAFGAILRALMPLALAGAAGVVALAAILLMAGFQDVALLARSILTMLALALGIDYALFVHHRFRQLRAEKSAEAAMEGAMTSAGRVVLYSGGAVAIGMAALLLTPLMQTRSIGLGGLAATIASMAAALTLLPALLSIGASRRSSQSSAESTNRHIRINTRWAGWGRTVVNHPWLAILCSVAMIAAMAAPAARTVHGFPEEDFLPRDLQSVRGLDMLETLGWKGLSSPINIVVSREDGAAVIDRDSAAGLSQFVANLRADPRVARVDTPMFSANAAFLPFPVPDNEVLVSEDESRILIRLIPASESDLAVLRELARDIPARMAVPGLTAQVGGQVQYYEDFDREMRASTPLVIALVLVMTGALLWLLLRAPLAAAKAMLLNLLSVAAGFGMVVWVFQMGHGATLFGMSTAAGQVPASVPIVIFAILFGLSMDYEIFLISRMRELVMAGRNNRESIAEALGDTGAVISSAAAIMAMVFGAFAFSQILIVQMVGLGLAVAILVDAVLIRALLGPALMALAGRWNWWPLEFANRRG